MAIDTELETKTIIHDYLTGKEIDITHKPEELVRQNYLKELVEEYEYPKENIATEVPITFGRDVVKDINKNSPKRADIVIYKTSKKKYDEIYIIVETKKKDEENGEAQVKSYGNASTASIVIWTNETETKYWEKTNQINGNTYQPKLTLPKYNHYYNEKDFKLLKKDLLPASDLQVKFKKIHNNIYANTKSSDKTSVFNQMLYILFIKLYDEKLFKPECQFYISENEQNEILKTGNSTSFTKRIKTLFNNVKQSTDFSDVFSGKEEIELLPEQVAYIVSEIQYLALLYTDVKGEAFQAFINNYFRGDAGQFFTPDPIKKMMVQILKPEPVTDVIIDPACGSGGFLVTTIEYFKNLIKIREGIIDSNGSPLPDRMLSRQQKELVAGQVKTIANKNILGVDFDNNLTKIAKMYMVMVDDGHSGIFTHNSLTNFKELAETGRIKPECASVVMTNPPFGTKGKINRKDILENFDLGYKWKKDKKSQKYILLEQTEQNLQGASGKSSGQIPDVLFIERSYELLKPGGRMGIVLPDGDLSNESLEYVRQWIVDHLLVVGVISLPGLTFVPFGAGPKSSVLICIKPRKGENIPEDYPVFFAQVDSIGYDVRGVTTYKYNDKGQVIDKEGNPIIGNKGAIAKYGMIDTDIPDVIKAWDKFAEKNKMIYWE